MSGTSGSSGLGSFNNEQIESRTSEEIRVNVSTYRDYPFLGHFKKCPHRQLERTWEVDPSVILHIKKIK